MIVELLWKQRLQRSRRRPFIDRNLDKPYHNMVNWYGLIVVQKVPAQVRFFPKLNIHFVPHSFSMSEKVLQDPERLDYPFPYLWCIKALW